MSRNSLLGNPCLTDVNELFTRRYAEQRNVREDSSDEPQIFPPGYTKEPNGNAPLDRFHRQMAAVAAEATLERLRTEKSA